MTSLMNGGQATLPITVTVNEFSRLSGLGRNSIYKLLNSGKIKGVMVLDRRLIIISSYLEYLETIGE